MSQILPVKLDIPLSVRLNDSLEAVVEGVESMAKLEVQVDLLNDLRRLRKSGVAPIKFTHKKSAVELVREGRGN